MFKKLALIVLSFLLLVPAANATVASSTSRVKYTCSGGSSYAFTFGVGATSEIQVIKTVTATAVETTLTETTDYSISATNNDYSSGGTVNTTAACATGNTITILRNVPLTQDSDFEEGMPTLYETFEDSLDKLTRITQQQQEEINRAPKLPESFTVTSNLMPTPAANNYIGWNAGATNLENKAGPVITTATQYEIDALISYGSGSSYTQATIEAAIAAMDPEVGLLLRPGAWAITSALDLTGVKLHMADGAYFVITGAGSVTGLKETIPESFGAKANDVSVDSLSGLKNALYAVKDAHGIVRLKAGTYYKSDELVLPEKTHLVGVGKYSTTIENTVVNKNGIVVESNSGYYRGSSIEGITINHKGGSTLGSGILFGDYGHAHGLFKDILIQGFAYGVYLTSELWECEFNTVRSTSALITAFYINSTLGTGTGTSDNLFIKLYSDNPGAGGATGSGYYINGMNKSSFINCTIGNTSSTDTQFYANNARGLLLHGANVEGFTLADGKAAIDIAGTSVVDIRGYVFASVDATSVVGESAALIYAHNESLVNVESCAEVSTASGNLLSLKIGGGSTAAIYAKGNRWTSPYDETGNLSPYQIVATEGKLITKTVTAIDLSGAAAVVLLDPVSYTYGQIKSIKLLYTEASSGDAGITLTIGYLTSAAYIGSVTTEVSKPLGYMQTMTIDNAHSRIGAFPGPIYITSPGGKAGTGEVVVVMEYTMYK